MKANLELIENEKNFLQKEAKAAVEKTHRNLTIKIDELVSENDRLRNNLSRMNNENEKENGVKRIFLIFYRQKIRKHIKTLRLALIV